MKRYRTLSVLAALTLVVASCGGSGATEQSTTTSPSNGAAATSDSSEGPSELTFVMTEFGFEPSSVEVSAGEAYEFTFVNEGQVEHEARLDTVHGVEDHIAGGHEGHEHGEGPLAVLVPPGESKTLSVTFEGDATYEVIACTLPGHYEAGMFATLEGLEAVSADSEGSAASHGDVTTFDEADMEAVAGQARVVGILTGIDFVDTAGFHGMSEALGEGELTGRELGSVEKVIAAITSISWPHELEGATTSFLGGLETLAAALEAEDVETAAEAAHTVHESQHGFSHDVYAYLAGNGGHDHDTDMEAVAGQARVVGILTGIDFVDTAGFHGMSEALGEGELTGRELGSVEKVIAAITSISWPHELEGATTSFLGGLETLAAALEAEDVETAAEAAHTVHESQHGFSHDVYAYLAGNGGHDHDTDMEAVAGQARVVGILTGIDFVDTAGFHGMSEALGEGELTGRELGSVEKVIAAITSISWPHELEGATTSFLGGLETLAAALEAEDVETAAEAAHTVHESQHGFSHDVYAYLAGNGGHDH